MKRPNTTVLPNNMRVIDRPEPALHERRCSKPRCDARLSRYNLGDRCWVHDGQRLRHLKWRQGQA